MYKYKLISCRRRRPILADGHRNATIPPSALGIRHLRRFRSIVWLLAPRRGRQADAISTRNKRQVNREEKTESREGRAAKHRGTARRQSGTKSSIPGRGQECSGLAAIACASSGSGFMSMRNQGHIESTWECEECQDHSGVYRFGNSDERLCWNWKARAPSQQLAATLESLSNVVSRKQNVPTPLVHCIDASCETKLKFAVPLFFILHSVTSVTFVRT